MSLWCSIIFFPLLPLTIGVQRISFANPGRAREAALVQIARSADLWQIELARTSARSVMEDAVSSENEICVAFMK